MVIPAAFAAAIPPVKQLLGKLDVIVKVTMSLFVKVVVEQVAAVPTVVPFNFQSYVGVAPIFKAFATLNVTDELAQIVVEVFWMMPTLGVTDELFKVIVELVAFCVNKQLGSLETMVAQMTSPETGVACVYVEPVPTCVAFTNHAQVGAGPPFVGTALYVIDPPGQTVVELAEMATIGVSEGFTTEVTTVLGPSQPEMT